MKPKNPPTDSKATLKASLGKYGEQVVARLLEKNGFKILAKNYKKRFGEIDIIAYKEPVISFVEVKLRKNVDFALSQTVNYLKQKKIAKTALSFVYRTKNGK